MKLKEFRLKILFVTKIFLISFFLFSCQPIEKLDNVVIDLNLLPKIKVNSNDKTIIQEYQIKYEDPYIDHSIINPPILVFTNWIESNIDSFGNENNFQIIIKDASLTKIERDNENKTQFTEKTEYFYELNFLIHYILYDDNDTLIAEVNVISKRSTTSDKFISLNDKERIIDTLILDSIIDITKKSEDLLQIHMSEHIL